MAAWRDPVAGRPRVYVAQRGQIEEEGRGYAESTNQFVDKLVVLDGSGAEVLAELPARRPRAWWRGMGHSPCCTRARTVGGS